VIDEVLGAGDAYFAAKATVRMLDLCKQGRALIFVSHSMSSVQLLCDTAIWMDNGQVRAIGPVDEIARRYEADFRRQEDEHLRAGNATRASLLADVVVPEEVGRPDLWRFRLTGEDGRLHDTHYVRLLELALAHRNHRVGLEFADIDDPEVEACLDLSSSEWGRLHERNGHPSRALSAGSSMFRGGHVLARTPVASGEVGNVEVAVESSSLGGTEELVLQFADAASGRWTDLELLRRETANGWTRTVFAGSVTHASEADHAAHLERAAEIARPDIEIVSVRMLVEGEDVLAVREHQPFAIEVEIQANRKIPLADIWVKFTRADGVYVFWQSSGQSDTGNLRDVEGRVFVRFEFEPNLFGAGDYEVEVTAANGFDLAHNWPHSQVFDRRIGALKFTVSRESRLLMMGPVNHRFPVSVRMRDPQERHKRSIATARADS
jgi:lipopolysaccharide transport system ATP-binding protein